MSQVHPYIEKRPEPKVKLPLSDKVRRKNKGYPTTIVRFTVDSFPILPVRW